jgi:hypothetical protein
LAPDVGGTPGPKNEEKSPAGAHLVLQLLHAGYALREQSFGILLEMQVALSPHQDLARRRNLNSCAIKGARRGFFR